ncbi:PPK2 family polyphosphate kinase [Flavobacteriaceae bacterium LMO-SS05]
MKSVPIKTFKVMDPIQVGQLKTRFDLGASKEDIEDNMVKVRKKLGKLQNTMYAHGQYAVLVCLQGMDTSGKDSLIREVFKDFNTQGIVVNSFKTPTDLELRHDYLWRHYMALPPSGKFGVFNRTHYENVLVTRVHPEYILNEHIPTVKSIEDIDENFWNQRFEQINNFEKHISENGTIIFKFFLNLSKKEQKNRLLRRLVKQEKNWKFSPDDIKERELWDTYQHCYVEAINNTSTDIAPWYIIPADDKATARYLVARVLYDTLKTFTDIKEPELDDEIKTNLDLYKRKLESE